MAPPEQTATAPLSTYPTSSHQEIHTCYSKVFKGLKYLILLGPPGAPLTALSTRISSAHFPSDHLLPSSPYASRLLNSTRAMRRAPWSMDSPWCHLSINESVRKADPRLLVSALCEQVKAEIALGDGQSERCFIFEDFPRSLAGCKAFEEKFGKPDYILILDIAKQTARHSFLSSHLHISAAETTAQVFETRHAEFCRDIPAVEMRYRGIVGRVDAEDGDGNIEGLYERVKVVVREINEEVIDAEDGVFFEPEMGDGIDEVFASVSLGGDSESA